MFEQLTPVEIFFILVPLILGIALLLGGADEQ